MSMTEISLTSPPGMVAVGMGDDGPVNTLPGINIKISRRTIEAFVGKFNQGHAGGYAINMPAGESLQVHEFTSSRVGVKKSNGSHRNPLPITCELVNK